MYGVISLPDATSYDNYKKNKGVSEFVFNVQPTANVIWRLDNNENNDNYKKNNNGVRKN